MTGIFRREHEEDSMWYVKGYPKDIQQAWNLMSMHNSELLLENYQLKEQIDRVWKMSIFKFALWKVKGLFRSRYE
jgi:hypothetical protein